MRKTLSGKNGKYKWILHVKDHFSKISVLYALKNKTAEAVAKKLELYFRHYGALQIVQCDNGREFKGAVYILLRLCGIAIVHGAARTPQTQGLVERANGVAEAMIRARIADTGDLDWDKHLTEVTWSLNSYVSAATGYSATTIMFRDPIPLDAKRLILFNQRQTAVIKDENGELIPNPQDEEEQEGYGDEDEDESI